MPSEICGKRQMGGAAEYKKRPYVIPYFIPHRGCPHQCLFCNQHAITGVHASEESLVSGVAETLDLWLARRGSVKGEAGERETQFSFYGGSFTCLPIPLQERLLQAVKPYLQRGDIQLIRMSTRPDCISDMLCDFLYAAGVRIVELGVQSFDGQVLQTAKRGHSAEDCERAAAALQRVGIAVGVQLMPGLPQETRHSFLRGVRRAIALQPALVRLYPALVVDHSGLAEMFKRGEYTPLSLDQAVVLVRWAKELFDAAGIPVVRMGLQAADSLEEHLLAGPYHPAFGEMVVARQWFVEIKKLFAAYPDKNICVTLSSRDISAFWGQKAQNRRRYEERGLAPRLTVVPDSNLPKGQWNYAIC